MEEIKQNDDVNEEMWSSASISQISFAAPHSHVARFSDSELRLSDVWQIFSGFSAIESI